MKILMVLTSHDQLGNTGKKTGFWLEEFAAPYYTFKDAGAQLTLVSPKGGQPPLDPKSDEPDAQTAATDRFHKDSAAQSALASTGVLNTVRAEDYDAVFYPGGHGPLWDLAEDPFSIALIESFYNGGQTGGGGLSCAGGVAPRQECGRPAIGQRQARDGLHQLRRSRCAADGCGAVFGRGHAQGQRWSFLQGR